MKHVFIPSRLDNEKGLCLSCKRKLSMHLAIAECEACGAKGNVEIFGAVSNPRALALCAGCTAIEEQANTASIELAKTSEQLTVVERDLKLQSETNKLIEQAQLTDKATRESGDIFNARTISNSELKAEVWSDPNLSEQAKHERFTQLMLERIETFKPLVRALDDEKHRLLTQQYADIQTLREFGNGLRNETRERIRLADANYVPNVSQKEVKLNSISKKKDPNEKMIEAIALAKGISNLKARLFAEEKGLLIKESVEKKLTPFDRVVEEIAKAKGITIEEAKQLAMKGGLG